MAEPFTLATIAAGCVWGLIGNRADAAAVAGGRKLAGVLAGTQTPQNHDVLRATHAAWLKSVQVMAGLAEGATTRFDDHPTLAALKKAVRDPALTEFRFGGGNFPDAELERLVRDIYRADADPDAVAVEAVIARLEGVMGQPLTEGLRAVFRSGHAGKRGWAATFQLFFSQAVKDDEAVFRILTFERLNEVVAFAGAHAEALAELERELRSFRAAMHDRFDAVAATQDVHTALLNQILANQGKGQQASIELLRALAQGYAEQHHANDLEGLQSYLHAKIDQWRDYRARIEELEAEGNRDAALLADAKAATDRGDFATADALLAEAVEALDDKIAPLLIAKSARIALRGENARVAGDYAAAMRFLDEAAAILPAQAGEERLARLCGAANAQREWGARFGDPWLLPDAIRRWREIAEFCSLADDPDNWAMAQNNLGVALRLLGERENGTARLEEAVVAYRLALEKRPHERVPLLWAETQNNLGNALLALGRRETGTARLKEAVQAYRSALEERTGEQAPNACAMTLNNMGNALVALSKRERDPDGLRHALTVYRSALNYRRREYLPLAWAMTQNNLGGALLALGKQANGTTELEESVAAYRFALEERTRERVPYAWARTQYNLGNALSALGEREDGTARLMEAVEAYRLALEERTVERVPLYWARTTLALIVAMIRLHDRGGELSDLAGLREQALQVKAVLVGEADQRRIEVANHVIAEIDRIIAAQPH